MSATVAGLPSMADLRGLLETATAGLTRPGVLKGVDARAMVPTLQELDYAMRFANLKYPFALMYRNGRQDPPSAFTEERATGAQRQSGFLDYRRALRLLQQGHSMELGAIEYWHPRCSRAAADIALHFGARADAQAFLTPPGRQGLATHRDRTHVLAVQIAGEKRWKVHDRPQDDNWRSGNADDPGPLALDHVMRPGEILYFPAGCAHTVVAEDQALSAHVTFGLHGISRRDVEAAVTGQVLRWASGGPGAADVAASAPLSLEEAEADVLAKVRALLARPEFRAELRAKLTAHRRNQASSLPPQQEVPWWDPAFFQSTSE